MKIKYLLLLLGVVFLVGLLLILTIPKKGKGNDTPSNQTEEEEEKQVDYALKITVNGKELYAEFEQNSSTQAFIQKLKEQDIVIAAHDYGSFEKVGELGFSLPTNDQTITVSAGDIILYQGNQITIYYDNNRWSFTKLGHIQDVNQEELKKILGSGDVTFTLSLVEK